MSDEPDLFATLQTELHNRIHNNNFVIDVLDEELLHLLIKASNSHDLTEEERVILRAFVDRWKLALALADRLIVTF